MDTNKSEVAQLLRRIDLEHQSCKEGLTGIASGTARHDFISTKTENIERYHEQLVQLVGPEEAIALVATAMCPPVVNQGTTQR